MRRFLSMCTVALVMVVAASVPARAADPDPGMRAAVDSFVKALNTNGPAGKSCAPSATIIDEFPPYVWDGPGACAKWLADIDKIEKAVGMTHVSFATGKTLYSSSSGPARGEIVVSTRLTGTIKGKAVIESAAWTFVLTKTGGTWQISGIAWGHTAG
jgi:hypothetical protein